MCETDTWVLLDMTFEECLREQRRIESLENKIIQKEFIKNISNGFSFIIQKQLIVFYDKSVWSKEMNDKNENKWFKLNEFNFDLNLFWNHIVFNELNNTFISFGGMNKHFIEYNFNRNTFL